MQHYADNFSPATVFDTAAFAVHNATKVEAVRVIEAGNLAQVVGIAADGTLRAPFSAPYAQPAVRKGTEPADADYSLLAGKLLAAASGGLRLVLPPPIYDIHEGRWQSVLENAGLQRVDDLNFHIRLDGIANFDSRLTGAAPRNMRRALKAGFELVCHAAPRDVYRFIAAHHASLGYHMAMSEEDVLSTAPVAHTEFFDIMLDGQRVGAAIFDVVAPGIAQLINWGDALTHRNLRTSSFMARAIAEHYTRRGFTALDLGPASTDGIPNTGLVRFKTSLGAIQTHKHTFIK